MPEEFRGTSVLQGIVKALERKANVVISFDHKRYTLSSLDDSSTKLASYLSAVVSPGDRIGVVARNGFAALISWWAATKCGAILVPYNTFNVGAILSYQISDSAPKVIIAESEFIEKVLRCAETDGAPLESLIVDGDISGVLGFSGTCISLDNAVAQGDSAFDYPLPSGRDPSHLIYTSGTTGPSKACIVGHSYICNMALDMIANVRRIKSEIIWTSLPMFHLAAVAHVAGSIFLGSSISVASRFSVSRFWDDIEQSEATIAALMGSMFPMIARAPETAAAVRVKGQLRTTTGSPVTEELARTWTERFGVDRVGAGAYGMTEASLITSTPPGAYRPGTSGKENDSFEVRIVNDDGYGVPANTAGEIVCRPKRPGAMFDGYWNRPEHTLSVFRDLWFRTGDLGRIDDDGYLHFVDRAKDYLRRGGENISSYEVEGVYTTHPDVVEVVVHAVPSQLSEDDVKVTAVLREGSDLTEADLYEWSVGRIPSYALPSFIEFRKSFPKNAVGRTLKYELRSEGVTTGTWQR